MVLHSSGAISMNQIHIEAGGNSGTRCSLNDSDFRALSAVAGRQSMGYFYGKSSAPPPPPPNVPTTVFWHKLLKDGSFKDSHTFINPQSKHNNVYLSMHMNVHVDYWVNLTVEYTNGTTRNLGYYWGIGCCVPGIWWIPGTVFGGGFSGSPWSTGRFIANSDRGHYIESHNYWDGNTKNYTSQINAARHDWWNFLFLTWKIERLARNGQHNWKWSSIGGNIAKITVSTNQIDYPFPGSYGVGPIHVLWDN